MEVINHLEDLANAAVLAMLVLFAGIILYIKVRGK